VKLFHRENASERQFPKLCRNRPQARKQTRIDVWRMPERESVRLLGGLRRVNSALAVDQRLLCLDNERHTRLRQVNIALGAIEEPDSNLTLEIANLLAQ
jgi:hypothetical protein